MLETLMGTLFGGLFRLAPEVLKWADRKNERAHELAMFGNQLEADKLRGNQQLAVTTVHAETTIGEAEIQAIIQATKAQSTKTNIKWVDALNSLVRPMLAIQWLLLLWPAVVVAGFATLVIHGTDPLIALKASFGVEEKALATSVASFWLVDRSLRKIFGKK